MIPIMIIVTTIRLPYPLAFQACKSGGDPVYHHSHDQNLHPPHLKRVFSSQRGWRPIVDTPSPLSMVPAWESLQKEWCGRGGSYPPTCLWIPPLSLLLYLVSLRVMRTPYQSLDWKPFACLSFRLFASEIRKGQIQARDPPVVLFSMGILNIEDINQIWVFCPNFISCRQHVIRAWWPKHVVQKRIDHQICLRKGHGKWKIKRKVWIRFQFLVPQFISLRQPFPSIECFWVSLIRRAVSNLVSFIYLSARTEYRVYVTNSCCRPDLPWSNNTLIKAAWLYQSYFPLSSCTPTYEQPPQNILRDTKPWWNHDINRALLFILLWMYLQPAWGGSFCDQKWHLGRLVFAKVD